MIDPTQRPRQGVAHLLDRVPDRVREALDTFNFWAGVSIFGIGVLVICLFYVNGKTSAAAAKANALSAAHSAEIVANGNAQYHQCLTNMPTLRRINAFAAGVASVDELIRTTAKDTLKVTPKGSPLWVIRTRYVHELTAFIITAKHVHFPVPTRKGCEALRTSLLQSP